MISPEDTDQEGEAVSRCMKEDLTQSFEVVLKDLPEVYLYIQRLNEHIQKQQFTLVKLYGKLKEYRQTSFSNLKAKAEVKNASTQTEPLSDNADTATSVSPETLGVDAQDHGSEWTSTSGIETGKSLADEIKEVAESAMQQTGFVYEETSGMYYDYNTGYYYNAEMGLYYDGNSGTYLYYNEGTKSYEYHSQAAVSTPVVAERPVQSSTPAINFQDKTLEAKTLDRIKSSKLKLEPLETKETDLNIPGSNPMAPVLSESSNISPPREPEPDKKSLKESKREHKRKGKHKKHKSKKKKKRKHRSSSRGENTLEEGECSGSSESECDRENEKADKMSVEENCKEAVHSKVVLPINDVSMETMETEIPKCQNVTPAWNKYRRLSDEASEAWPPCMRIIVENTEVKNLSVGTLFIVTCKGGTLGREKFHAVPIPDINISKHHGIFTFDDLSGKYYLTDYGSRNGTYVNKQRLSSAKQESEPCEISHGTIITLGSTILLCHIHPGRETCEECEPGVVAAKKAEDLELQHPSSNAGESKSEKRLQELRRLRKRFGLEGNESKSELAPGYEDRAEIRRVTVGSHNEHAKTEMASAVESIRSTNKGFKMLAKMGWKEGESLGKDGTGRTEPVLVSQRAEKAGLGAEGASSLGMAMTRTARAKADKWQRARQRYGQLPDTVEDGDDDE